MGEGRLLRIESLDYNLGRQSNQARPPPPRWRISI